MTSYKIKPKAANIVRLEGALTININGQPFVINDAFKIQTDLKFSGLSEQNQQAVMAAYQTALQEDNDVTFSLELLAKEIPVKGPKELSPLEKLLADLNKPTPEALTKAALENEEAVKDSLQGSLKIMGELKKGYK